ncbi:hypothetical protein [Actinomadura alba]|uniref:Uncharacterized protein n=1 Tax=Actinomadura alba TaxID=406431 RepID=A0ABR7LNC2_9ACTN|nr:hypothetical protein [Actinomadura alba]MBC6466351.1 hypothetical protein [Actinomadura alba]
MTGTVVFAIAVVSIGNLLVSFWTGIFLGVVSIFAIPIIRLCITGCSINWWASGAGHPVLVVQDGWIFGRLRPVWSDAAKTVNVNDTDWWDFKIRADTVTGVRLLHSDQPPKAHKLALDLPADVRSSIRDSLMECGMEKYVEHIEELWDTPAMWMIGGMQPIRRRSSGIQKMLAALQEAGAPTS